MKLLFFSCRLFDDVGYALKGSAQRRKENSTQKAQRINLCVFAPLFSLREISKITVLKVNPNLRQNHECQFRIMIGQ